MSKKLRGGLVVVSPNGHHLDESAVTEDSPPFTFKPKNELQRQMMESWYDTRLFILMGHRGTGKTSAGIGMGLHEITHNRKVGRVVVTRPTVGVGPPLGFFPGDLDQKLAPWFAAVEDVLDGFELDAKAVMASSIDPVALCMLEGRTFTNCVFVADELQHATEEQLDLIVSRIGYRCRAVLCGSPRENDAFFTFAQQVSQHPKVRVLYGRPEDQVRDPFVSELEAIRSSFRRR